MYTFSLYQTLWIKKMNIELTELELHLILKSLDKYIENEKYNNFFLDIGKLRKKLNKYNTNLIKKYKYES